MADRDRDVTDHLVGRKISKPFGILGFFEGEIQFTSIDSRDGSKLYHVYYRKDGDQEDLTFAEIVQFLVPLPGGGGPAAAAAAAAAASTAATVAGSDDRFRPVDKVGYTKKEKKKLTDEKTKTKTFTSYLFPPERGGRRRNRIMMNPAMVFVSIANIDEYKLVFGTQTFVLKHMGTTYLGQKIFSCLAAELKAVPAVSNRGVVEAFVDLELNDSAPKLGSLTW